MLFKRRLLVLSLENNHLSRLPNDFFTLVRLENLHLKNNNLQTLSEQMIHLKALTSIHLHGNRQLTLPKAIQDLPKLSYLHVDDNTLTEKLESTLRNKNISLNKSTALSAVLGNRTNTQNQPLRQ